MRTSAAAARLDCRQYSETSPNERDRLEDVIYSISIHRRCREERSSFATIEFFLVLTIVTLRRVSKMEFGSNSRQPVYYKSKTRSLSIPNGNCIASPVRQTIIYKQNCRQQKATAAAAKSPAYIVCLSLEINQKQQFPATTESYYLKLILINARPATGKSVRRSHLLSPCVSESQNHP